MRSLSYKRRTLYGRKGLGRVCPGKRTMGHIGRCANKSRSLFGKRRIESWLLGIKKEEEKKKRRTEHGNRKCELRNNWNRSCILGENPDFLFFFLGNVCHGCGQIVRMASLYLHRSCVSIEIKDYTGLRITMHTKKENCTYAAVLFSFKIHSIFSKKYIRIFIKLNSQNTDYLYLYAYVCTILEERSVLYCIKKQKVNLGHKVVWISYNVKLSGWTLYSW